LQICGIYTGDATYISRFLPFDKLLKPAVSSNQVIPVSKDGREMPRFLQVGRCTQTDMHMSGLDFKHGHVEADMFYQETLIAHIAKFHISG
jgi:hypothetical protein